MAHRGKHHFGVPLGGKAVRARRLQFATQLEVIVHLAVEHEHIVADPEGLVGPFSGVQNAQPAVTEHHVFFVGPHAFCIGSAVGDVRHHVPHARRGVCQSLERLKSVGPCDPAHQLPLSAEPFNPSQPWACKGTSGPFLVTSVNASGAATAWPMTLSLGWFRTFS